MKIRDMIGAAMFAAITAIFAQVSIPIPGLVPITLQVLAVCLASAILGSRLGAISQLMYVALGAIGLPVFAAGTAGLEAIIGPRGGYIIGFVLASYVIGKIAEKTPLPTPINTFLAMVAGLIVIYAAGIIQLSAVTGIGLKAAFFAGALPFLLPDLIKIGLGSYVACSVRHTLIKERLLPTK
jgi:biotin transport system substrate-specific component